MLAIYGSIQNIFLGKNCIWKTAMLNHFVTLQNVRYWEENNCKQTVQPPKYLSSNCFVVTTPL